MVLMSGDNGRVVTKQDAAMLGHDLTRLPLVMGLRRRASRIIRQNLWISLAMVTLLVPATLFGLQPGATVVFHER